MKVFQFNTKDDQAYLFASSEVSDKCHPDPPRSLAADWVPPTFELVGSDEFRSYLPKTDFPTFTIATMVLDARAVARLRPILESCGEILPIRLSNDRDPLYLFNVTKIVNAVDMRRSRFMELPSGAIGPCELLVFDPTKLPSEPLFFKNTQMGTCTEIFATEAAVEAVKRSLLTDYDFRLVWSND